MKLEQYVAESTEKSGVPLKVADPQGLQQVAAMLTSSNL
jgi:hypothetical protein